MAPNIVSTGALYEDDYYLETNTQQVSNKNDTLVESKDNYKREIVWPKVALYALLHMTIPFSLYLLFTSTKLATILFTVFLYIISGFGITGGAHRLWSHRSYKANVPLRLILIFFNTVAFQDTAFNWARNHRLHHKYCDTDADPHNSKKGFFFCHMGWLMSRKHPAILDKAKGTDFTDLYNDPILMFQHKYYLILMPTFSIILPIMIPMYFWNETFLNSFFVAFILRFVCVLNVSCMINSVAHIFGNRPYDKNITPCENKPLSLLTMGEAWHNYHHTFPWDYKAAELGDFKFNLTTQLVEFFANVGWAYDLKIPSVDMVKRRVQRTGDGSHELWGWGDKDQTQEDRNDAIVTHKHTD